MKKSIILILTFLIQFNAYAETTFFDSILESVTKTYDTTLDYWAPKVSPTLDTAVEFWAPKVEKTIDTTTKYWAPKVSKTLDTTFEYWTPRVESALETSARIANDSVIPRIRTGYAAYMDGPGEQIAENFWISYSFVVNNAELLAKEGHGYISKSYPVTYTYFANTPAFIKQSYESSIISIWQWLYTLSEEELSSIPEDKRVSVDMAMAAGQALKEEKLTAEGEMLNRLLDDIRPYTVDYGMQDCYKIVLIDSSVANTFNIGCNIFFARDLIEMLDGDERLLRAVIAHEVSHGERGHGIKTLMSLIGSIATHYTELTMQELLWIATGQAEEKLKKVAAGARHFDFIMDDFSSKAPKVEIDADKHATGILMRAGYSENDLIDALEVLHTVTKSLDCEREKIESNGKRDYPTFCARKEAILKAAQ